MSAIKSCASFNFRRDRVDSKALIDAIEAVAAQRLRIRPTIQRLWIRNSPGAVIFSSSFCSFPSLEKCYNQVPDEVHIYLWREMLSRNKCTPTCAAWGNTGSISTERLEMMAHFNSNLFGYNLIFALSGQLLEMCLSNYQYGFISLNLNFVFMYFLIHKQVCHYCFIFFSIHLI